MAETPTPEQLQAAEGALSWVYPDLKFERSQITTDAALFAFVVMRKVNIGARAAYGMFKLYSLVPPGKWSAIPKQVTKAVLAALQKPGKSLKSQIALAFIAWPHQRNLQLHLREPETYPCPDFRDSE